MAGAAADVGEAHSDSSGLRTRVRITTGGIMTLLWGEMAESEFSNEEKSNHCERAAKWFFI